MNSSDAYNELCEEIWQFYESQKAPLTDAYAKASDFRDELSLVSPWLPPPPDRCDSKIKLLFVGLSPKRLSKYRYATSLNEAKEQAREYRYTSSGTPKDIRFHYDTYYQPLLSIAKCLNPNYEVWHKAKNDSTKLLVEFTDFCHLPAHNHSFLRLVFDSFPHLKDHCRKILARELFLFRPDIVVANGVDTSIDLWEMHFGKNFSNYERTTVINSFLGIENCNVHLSRFLGGKDGIDRFNKARLLNEISQHANSQNF